MKKFLLPPVLSALCAVALAQVAGSIGGVNGGLVTVTRGQQLISVTPGTPLQAGDIILTTPGATANVTINTPSGPCTVSMPGSTALSVAPNQSCAAIQAAVTPVTPGPPGAAGGVGSGQGAAIFAAAIAPIGWAAYEFYLSRR